MKSRYDIELIDEDGSESSNQWSADDVDEIKRMVARYYPTARHVTITRTGPRIKPPVLPERPDSRRVVFRVSRNDHSQILRAAERSGLTVDEFMLKVLRDGLKEHHRIFG